MFSRKGPVDTSAEGLERPSDEELARRAQEGDRDAVETLVRRYVRVVHAVVASWLPEPADVEDAAQEAFLRALAALGRFDVERPFAPWLYQIARNVARNRAESRSRWKTEELTEAGRESARARPDAELESAELRRLVTEAMETLPDQQRIAFRLSDVEGYRSDEVARIMGLTAGTVRSHIHHARRALRASLRRRLDETDIPGRQQR